MGLSSVGSCPDGAACRAGALALAELPFCEPGVWPLSCIFPVIVRRRCFAAMCLLMAGPRY